MTDTGRCVGKGCTVQFKGLLPWGESGRGLQLTDHLHPLPSLTKSASSYNSTTSCDFVVCPTTNLQLLFSSESAGFWFLQSRCWRFKSSEMLRFKDRTKFIFRVKQLRRVQINVTTILRNVHNSSPNDTSSSPTTADSGTFRVRTEQEGMQQILEGREVREFGLVHLAHKRDHL